MAEVGPILVWPFPRSGGTLLTTMLGVHRAIAMAYEIYEENLVDDLGAPYEPREIFDLVSKAAERAGIETGERLTSIPWSERLDTRRTQRMAMWIRAIDAKPLRTFVARAHRSGLEPIDLLEEIEAHDGSLATTVERLRLIERLMRRQMRLEGKERWGGKVKAPLDAIACWQPSSTVLMVVRDGRDVLASRRSVGNFDADPKTCAREWVAAVASFEAFRQTHSGPTMIVRYESLVVEPERTLDAVCSTAGVELDTVMIRYHEAGLPLLRNSYGHLSAAHISEGLNARTVGRWRDELDKAAVSAFEFIAGDTLARMGM